MSGMRSGMVVVALCACGIGANCFAVDHAAARGAWHKRLDEHAAVSYEATIRRGGAKEEQPPSERGEVRVVALLRCDERKFRIDTRPVVEKFGGVHILDSRGFHTSLQTLPGKWEAKTQRSISRDSSWLPLYPFLLAHGVVPIPPLDAPKLPPKDSRPGVVIAGLGTQRLTFDGDARGTWSVAVGHASDDAIESIEIVQDRSKALELRLSYQREKGQRWLRKFTIRRFDAKGKLIDALEGEVTACRLDASIPLTAFVPPRTRDEVHTTLTKRFERPIVVKPEMSLAEVAESVQKVLGEDAVVRIDAELFNRAENVDVEELEFEPGEPKLGDVLLRELRNNRVDFRVDPQGIVLIPRNDAWQYAESAQYSANDYGLTVKEMRTRVYNAATLDDWSDVGGQAMIVTGKEEPTIMVLHTQSDHFRFQEALRKGNE